MNLLLATLVEYPIVEVGNRLSLIIPMPLNLMAIHGVGGTLGIPQTIDLARPEVEVSNANVRKVKSLSEVVTACTKVDNATRILVLVEWTITRSDGVATRSTD